MTSIARKLLNELMGPDRNKPLGTQGQSAIRYTQREVCKHFLVDFCPYEAFLNTKSDIGPCPCRVHDARVKEEFQRHGTPEHRESYEKPFYDLCWRLLDDLERKIRKNKERIDQPSGLGENDELDEQRISLERQIRDLLTQVEALGEKGKVSEAQEMMSRVDALQAEVEKIRSVEIATSSAASVDPNNPLVRLDRRMELCPTCGSFLIVNDTPARVQAHFQGRQHNGWVQVRAALERYKANKSTRAATDNRPQDRRGDSHYERHDSYSRQPSSRDVRDHRDHRDHHDNRHDHRSHRHDDRKEYSRHDDRRW